MHSILEIDSVRKEYSGRVILSDIYLKCKTGDIIGLFGRNGTGKSTLLKIVFGIEEADNQFVKVDELVLGIQSKTSQQISYLSQDTFLPNHLTVLQLIRLSLDKSKLIDFENDHILRPLLLQKISFLSGGELRYLEIKLLLNLPSKFILLDEPFNGLSPLLIEHITEMIKLFSKSKGIIITDHNYLEVLSVSNRFFLLNDGCLAEINGEEDLHRRGYLNSRA